ncbi:hypothetical protein THRCLA_01823 [Thraustotheca clavata]|uniref:Uncharacterized protein n=1 Tax=Thraustotheca clavata TaxID=74557 RepID=A0A1W0A7D2_9STRA|nr:hypothetical protein THRCLA_01823 [Thraustotheca clavata]
MLAKLKRPRKAPDAAIPEDLHAARKQRRREQVRINQRNLRLRQRQLNLLEEDVKCIERQIIECGQSLQELRHLNARDDFFVANFAQYLKMHINGVLPMFPDKVAEQRRITRFLFRDDVVYGGVPGQAYIEEQWLKWAGFHPKFKLVPTGFEVIHSHEATVLRVPVELTFVMTRLTVEAVYPHILAREDIMQKILGTEFVVQAGFLAYFDENGHIERMETWTDLTSTFANALGTLEASTLLANSEIHDLSHIHGAQTRTQSLYEQFDALNLGDGTDEASSEEGTSRFSLYRPSDSSPF